MPQSPDPSTRTYFEAVGAAERASRRAGDLIRSAAGSVSRSDVRDKGIHDIVTDTDLESQRLIIDTLRSVFPDHSILAEETADADDRGVAAGSGTAAGGEVAAGSETGAEGTDRAASETAGGTGAGDPAGSEFQWIIDPIDGTTNFTRGVPPYAVSIALAHRRKLVVGVVYDVAHDDMYSAVADNGLLVNGEPASVSDTPTLSQSLVTTGFPYRAFSHVDLYLPILRRFMEGALGVRRPGSASVDLAWVASGRFDGFFETGLKPWDVAAGIVLVREGGGRISDYRGNPDPAFDQQIVASNGHVHGEMLEWLSPMRHVTD